MTISGANTQRTLIVLVVVLGLSVWFSATAVVSSLRLDWGIGSTAAVWLSATVQIGFAAGAIISAAHHLADRIEPQRLVAVSAAGAAACTAALALYVDDLAAAVPIRFCTGMFLAGVYPVGMKLIASWSQSSSRGMTFGLLVGALALGSALPQLIGGLGSLPWRTVLLAASALTAAAAVIAGTLVRPGPHVPATRSVPGVSGWHPRQAIALFAQRGPRLVNLGYLGHMWELYALWVWLPVFVAAGRTERAGLAAMPIGVLAFVTIGVAGAVGCLLGGWAADRFGRPQAAMVALVISGVCCLASPVFLGAPTVIFVVFLMIWGAAAVADSGVFSVALSDTADPRFVGTALTAQTATGFLLTVVTIQLVPLVADLIGWQYAFLLLAPGPLLGAIAMSRLRTMSRLPQLEEDHDQLRTTEPTARRSDRGTLTHRR